jgi:hypothetical protein
MHSPHNKLDSIDYEKAAFSCDVMNLHMFPYYDLSLNDPTQSNDSASSTDLVALRPVHYNERLKTISSAGIELVQDRDGQLNLFGCIELGTDDRKTKITIDPYIGAKFALNTSSLLEGYSIEPSSHQSLLTISENDRLAAHVAYTQEKTSSYFEISTPVRNDSPHVKYEDIQFGCSIWALVHSGIVAAHDVGRFKLPPEKIDVFVGQTGQGTVTDLQIALHGKIGKLNASRPDTQEKLVLSDDINGTALEEAMQRVLPVLPVSEYASFAEAIVEGVKNNTLTHLDVLQAIRARAGIE